MGQHAHMHPQVSTVRSLESTDPTVTIYASMWVVGFALESPYASNKKAPRDSV